MKEKDILFLKFLFIQFFNNRHLIFLTSITENWVIQNYKRQALIRNSINVKSDISTIFLLDFCLD